MLVLVLVLLFLTLSHGLKLTRHRKTGRNVWLQVQPTDGMME